VALWRIGELLVASGVEKPHSIGREIERATNGIIKRPLIFRAFKIRLVWQSESQLLKECAGLRAISNVVEMLPYLDPTLDRTDRIGDAELDDLLLRMRTSGASEFREYLTDFKRTHASGRVGETNPRDGHLGKTSREFCHLIRFVEEVSRIELDCSEESRLAVLALAADVEVEAAAALVEASLDQSDHGRDRLATSSEAGPDWYRELAVLATSAGKQKRARLRRLVGVQMLSKVAGMLRASRNPRAWRRLCELRLDLGGIST